MKKLAALAATAAALAFASPANAVLLQFTISGTDLNGAIEYASFQLDSNPEIDGFFPGQGFLITAVPGVYRYGDTTLTTPQDLSFYTATFNGGLFVGNGDLLAFDSNPPLFTGSVEDPMFSVGTYQLTDFYSGAPISLVISNAVPEPATWAMMIGGFGVVGGAFRMRRTKVSYA